MIKVGIAGLVGLERIRYLFGHPECYKASDAVVTAYARTSGEPLAVLYARPIMWIHDLVVNPAMSRHIQARAVESALNFTFGWGPATARLTHGGIFQIATDNDRMEAIANSLGGVEIENSRTFRLDP